MTASTSAPRTLTFLFTDIEGSTRRWESQPEAMRAALARHDTLLRAAIEGAGGTVFKTVGDAFCAVFGSASEGLAAALAAQRALGAEHWAAFGPDFAALKVRMALHAGEAEARDGDWFGRPLNRVARLLAAGHGGQVLVADGAAALVAGGLPEGAALRSLGRHRLKDLAQPMEVHQAWAPGLAAEFPPLASLDRLRHNLPVQLTSFVGRRSELAALRDRLAAARLVTVTGPGGTGKTRLALQVAAEAVDDFPDGVFFVDLAPLADLSSVPDAVVRALGIPPELGREPLPTVLDFLRRWPRVLLVLDNCEHVLMAVAELTQAVLTAGPQPRVLATSREVLALPGEAVWPLTPLAVPETVGVAIDPVALSDYDGVRLFLDRAEAAQPGFRVTAANAAAVAQICRRLDGIPLALELAAARVRLFSPADLAARLDARFRVLTGGGRLALPRHQTLRACLDWSYDLLPPEERRVLERLGVFAGNIPLPAAEAVCADANLDPLAVLDALAGLEAKSLLVADPSGEGSSVRLLETVRAYARERLAESGDESDARDRHLAWCLAFAREAEPHTGMADQHEWNARYAGMMADIDAACSWGLTEARPERVQSAIEVALAVVHYGGWESWSWADAVDPAKRLDSPQLFAQVCYRAFALDRLADDIGAIIPVSSDEHVLVRMGRTILSGDRAIPDYYAALGLHREEAWILQDCGTFVMLQAGDASEALDLHEQDLAVKAAAAAPNWDIAISHVCMGEVYRSTGQFDLAEAQLERAELLHGTSPGYYIWRKLLLENLSACQAHSGKGLEAIRSATAALRHSLMDWDSRAALACLPWCACAHASAGHGKTAARLFGAAVMAYRAHGGSLGDRREIWSVYGQADWDHFAHGEKVARSLLSPADWDAAFAEGEAMSLDEAVAYALRVGERAAERGADG